MLYVFVCSGTAPEGRATPAAEAAAPPQATGGLAAGHSSGARSAPGERQGHGQVIVSSFEGKRKGVRFVFHLELNVRCISTCVHFTILDSNIVL